MITLSVDEIRVAAVIADAAVPSLLDQYATDEPGADAAARRGLLARGLLAGDASAPVLAATLTSLLAPLTAPHEVVEYEAVDLRAAQVRAADGTATSLFEVTPDGWQLRADRGVDTRIDADLAGLADRPAAPGDALELPVDAHQSLLMLLDSPAAVEGFLLHHLGTDGLRLVPALAAGSRAGRVIRTVRDGDVVTVERTGWLDGVNGVWRVEEADPDDLDARTRFVPCTGREVALRVADIRGLATAVAA